ncbi:isoaspartyl peptidase/L-asparaginase [Echinicola sp. CAU 1574]|uniref:Isoaspartyl peptidase/L-asparaginase n=1 Tax=Echinicola arenosa TaxID=2774144 RepID=A0ABR9AHU6_9BACT|nr:isoaspartyl peptidase/L-asparaginase [Echinicola arenosa]MBD8488414.1 isoaspartyl peptidase/L-asparaginase [Echinicola arenosa]
MLRTKTGSLFVLLFVFLLSCSGTKEENEELEDQNVVVSQEQPIALVIHGGAGTIKRENMTPEREQAYREKLAEALNHGYAVLEKGGKSVDAVIAAIKVMEDSPLFNAGKGAVFTHDARNEMDAAIMDGKTRNAGAVAGITTVKNPITAAFEVMQNSPHVFMVGKGAEQFAEEQGLEIVDPSYFREEKRYEQLMKIIESEQQQLDHSSLREMEWEDPYFNDRKYGTVGAVAVDSEGNVAAATSTGGMTNKRYGRVGDVPVIGAGTYADNATCAVSATGHGEFFIRNVVGHEIASIMRYAGKSLDQAAKEVVMDQLVKMEGSGGVISIDKDANISMPFNSAGMYRGYIKEKGKANTFIYNDEDEGL